MTGLQMGFQSPAHDPPAIGIQDDRQVGERLLHVDVGQIGHPELIEAAEDHAARQVGHHLPGMARVRRDRHERPGAQAQQVVLAHKTQHPLVVGRPAFTPQLRGDAPVAVVPVVECQTLDSVTQAGFLLTRRRGLPVAVVAGAADAGEPAHPLDGKIALRLWGRHVLDDGVDTVTPDPLVDGRAAPTRRKAC
jgi:hypothetical protein